MDCITDLIAKLNFKKDLKKAKKVLVFLKIE